jgi:hypothetical protein
MAVPWGRAYTVFNTHCRLRFTFGDSSSAAS